MVAQPFGGKVVGCKLAASQEERQLAKSGERDGSTVPEPAPNGREDPCGHPGWRLSPLVAARGVRVASHAVPC